MSTFSGFIPILRHFSRRHILQFVLVPESMTSPSSSHISGPPYQNEWSAGRTAGRTAGNIKNHPTLHSTLRPDGGFRGARPEGHPGSSPGSGRTPGEDLEGQGQRVDPSRFPARESFQLHQPINKPTLMSYRICVPTFGACYFWSLPNCDEAVAGTSEAVLWTFYVLMGYTVIKQWDIELTSLGHARNELYAAMQNFIQQYAWNSDGMTFKVLTTVLVHNGIIHYYYY